MPDEVTVEKALKKATETAEGKVLVVGYSPTGGGHTARTLNIVHQGIEDGHLKEGDCVVFHAPEVWESQRRAEVTKLITALKDKKINVVVARADKSVYGYLNQVGGSDDRKILKKLAMFPKRDDKERETDVTKAKLITADTKLPDDVNDFIYGGSGNSASKLISAKDLMQSVVRIIDDEKKEQIYLLTDMDPYLQKAAIKAGVSKQKCLDQQNHGVLLGALPDVDKLDTRDMLAEEAFLGKVLSASGGNISHIGLGERNTLQAVHKLATEKMEIRSDTKVESVKNQVVQILREKGNEYGHSGGRPDGVIWPKGLKEREDIKQIVYVYAHQKTAAIAEHIKKKLGIDPEGEADPKYANTVFLFCGAQAVTGYNAMHLAYLAEADGVTTAGAGTTGEFAYLHRAGNQSRLLVLPIEGHNEQECNAKVMAANFPEHVISGESTAEIPEKLDELIAKPAPSLEISEAVPRTMETLINAIGKPETYVKQASDILFTGIVDAAATEMVKMKALEEKMRNDPLLKASRHYVKLVFQVFDQIQQNLERYKTSDEKTPVTQPKDEFLVKYKKAGPEKKWTLAELKEMFLDKKKLYAALREIDHELEGEAPQVDLGSLQAVLDVLEHYEDTLITGDRKDISEQLGEIERAEENIGTKMKTGF